MRGLGARARHALDWRFAGVLSRLDAIAGRLDRLAAGGDTVAARLDALEAGLADVAARVDALAGRVDSELAPALRAVVTEEAENRRRLHAVRETPAYAAAFDDAEPLVSIVIPTHDRVELLLDRAIRSALEQTYEHIEVVVAGDAAPARVADAVRSLGDPRVRFAGTTHRVAHADPQSRWLVGSTLARNLGTRLARGAWIADLDDDDALRPDAVARLLRHAREHAAEVAYGEIEVHLPDGSAQRLSSFPPREREFGWQGALWHGGLRFFERELAAAVYGLPGDIFRAERMLRVGVRFAQVAAVTCDYYPATLWLPDREDDVADPVDVGDAHAAVQREGEQ